ncbi:MAG TPA: hypothetical protein VFW71_04310 [Actinomycetota bacterium]|nr:hypothetical protein [Actinomycetota bacterium]
MRPSGIWHWIGAHKLIAAGEAAALLVSLTLVGVAGYGRIHATTAASAAQALQQFRARAASPSPAPEPIATDTADPTPSPAPLSTPLSSPAAAGAATSTAAAAAPTPRPAVASAATPAPPPTACTGWDCPYLGPPAPGVTQWFQCGRTDGQCTGDSSEPPATETFVILVPITRDLPRTGVRTITRLGPNSWNITHVFANEHSEQEDLNGSASGVTNSRLLTDISVLGTDNSVAIREAPPFPAVVLPLAVGKTWSGHWDDANGGVNADYANAVLDRQTLTIGGQPVQTWVVDTHLKLLGPSTHGDVEMKWWVSLKYSETVQEYETQNIVDPHGYTYQSQWMITEESLTPAT